MPATFEPALASVSPNAAMVPSATLGSQRCFCSSLAAMRIGNVPSPVAANASDMPPSTLDSSSVTTHMFMMGRLAGHPAVFIGDEHAEEVGGGHVLDDRPRELVGLIIMRAHRLDLLLGQILGDVAHEYLLFGQKVIH